MNVQKQNIFLPRISIEFVVANARKKVPTNPTKIPSRIIAGRDNLNILSILIVITLWAAKVNPSPEIGLKKGHWKNSSNIYNKTEYCNKK